MLNDEGGSSRSTRAKGSGHSLSSRASCASATSAAIGSVAAALRTRACPPPPPNRRRSKAPRPSSIPSLAAGPDGNPDDSSSPPAAAASRRRASFLCSSLRSRSSTARSLSLSDQSPSNSRSRRRSDEVSAPTTSHSGFSASRRSFRQAFISLVAFFSISFSNEDLTGGGLWSHVSIQARYGGGISSGSEALGWNGLKCSTSLRYSSL
mmetsp:Transcript_67189/g.179485  ORF Transcript_67189/g.179485 Transcript_67189/m.179485 type:complete len:208 (-) Transcript_67189:208-831(-)